MGFLIGRFLAIAYNVVAKELVATSGTGLVKVLTYKVVLLGGKTAYVTLKVVGGAILGATISQFFFGG